MASSPSRTVETATVLFEPPGLLTFTQYGKTPSSISRMSKLFPPLIVTNPTGRVKKGNGGVYRLSLTDALILVDEGRWKLVVPTPWVEESARALA